MRKCPKHFGELKGLFHHAGSPWRGKVPDGFGETVVGRMDGRCPRGYGTRGLQPCYYQVNTGYKTP